MARPSEPVAPAGIAFAERAFRILHLAAGIAEVLRRLVRSHPPELPTELLKPLAQPLLSLGEAAEPVLARALSLLLGLVLAILALLTLLTLLALALLTLALLLLPLALPRLLAGLALPIGRLRVVAQLQFLAQKLAHLVERLLLLAHLLIVGAVLIALRRLQIVEEVA